MKFDFTRSGQLGRPKEKQNRYAIGRTTALTVLVLLAFFAVTTFPGYYTEGPDLQQWGMIVVILLAAMVALRFERACSSKMGKRPHDWNSSAGSLHAFSFVKCSCPKCGARRVLSYRAGKRVKYLTPGAAVPDSGSLELYCLRCGTTVGIDGVTPEEFCSSRVKRDDLRETAARLAAEKAYRLEKTYVNRYLTVTVILFLAEISSFYLARAEALRLVLPLAVGYFLLVSASNLVTAAMTAYYVTDDGVYQRVPGGYTLFPINGKTSLIHFSDGEKLAWGLYTETENLLISPIITNFDNMLADVKDRCRAHDVPIVE